MPFIMGGGSVPLIGRRAGALAGGGAPHDPFGLGVPPLFDYAAADLGLADGAAVAEWPDSGDNGHDLAAGGGTLTYRAASPVLGVPAVEFAAGWLSAAGFAHTGWTVFAVVERASTDNHGFVSNVSGEAIRMYAVGAELRLFNGGSFFSIASGAPAGAQVLAGRRTAGAGASRVTSSATGTANTGTTNATASDGVTVGALDGGAGTLALTGHVVRVVGFDGGLSDADMDEVAGQLAALYGVV